MTLHAVKRLSRLIRFPRDGNTASRLCAAAILCSSIICYVVFVKQFFPGPTNFIAFDYRYFLPMILAGKYFAASNGYIAAPIFTPSFCGGLPLLANPQSIYYSFPQLLSELVDPVRSFYITTVLFASTGGVGTYFLLRRRFALSREAATIGGVIFLFNGFLLHRMLVGHVTYHAIGLTPLSCFLLIKDSSLGSRQCLYSSLNILMRALGIAVIVGYFVYSGAVNMMIPLVIAVLLVWVVHAIFCIPTYASLWIGGIGMLFGGLLSAAKLAPAFVYIQAFPRPGQLILFDNLFRLLSTLAAGLFFPFRSKDLVFLGIDSVLLRHEGEFGVGIVPPVFIALTITCAILRHQSKVLAGQLLRKLHYWIVLCVICLVPVVVNYGGLGFDVFLKSVPYVNNNVALIRWFWVYIPLCCVITGILFDYIVRDGVQRIQAVVISTLATIIVATATDHRYYFRQTYDPSSIMIANGALDKGKAPPGIVEVGPGRNRFDNDGLVNGISAYPCYEPLFGYYLETFPPGLKTGRIGTHGTARLRNPACYIYGAANGCSPGEAFSPVDTEQAAMFAQYRSFRYVRPAWQKIADVLSVLSFLVVVVFPIYAIVRGATRRFLRPRAEGQGL
jgi:hypothetical protein